MHVTQRLGGDRSSALDLRPPLTRTPFVSVFGDGAGWSSHRIPPFNTTLVSNFPAPPLPLLLLWLIANYDYNLCPRLDGFSFDNICPAQLFYFFFFTSSVAVQQFSYKVKAAASAT